MPTNISFIGKSDMGRVRTNNEDACLACRLWDDKTYLLVAIDGVGGYEGGEIASAIAVQTIPDFLMASSNGERVELLKQAVTAANNAIFDARELDQEHSKMSCVLTAAIVDVEQRQICMAHVGDSRMYGFHHGVLKKMSHDHSLIGYREEIGDLTEEEAMHHPQRNIIGRDVGSQRHKANDEDFIEAQVFPLQPDTTLLLCSDGLTDMITSTVISGILDWNVSLETKADSLINAALDAGGKDNVTVVLFEYQSDEEEIDVIGRQMPDDTEDPEGPGDCPDGDSGPEENHTGIKEEKTGVRKPLTKQFYIIVVLVIVAILAAGVVIWRLDNQLTMNVEQLQNQLDSLKSMQLQVQQLEEAVNVLLNN